MLVTDDPRAMYRVAATTVDGQHACPELLTPQNPCAFPDFTAGPVRMAFEGERSFVKDVTVRAGDPARVTLSHRGYVLDGLFYGGLVTGTGLMIAGGASGAFQNNPPGASFPLFAAGASVFFIALTIGGFFMLMMPPHDYVKVEQPGQNALPQYARSVGQGASIPF
jgi:hypothetical protein